MVETFPNAYRNSFASRHDYAMQLVIKLPHPTNTRARRSRKRRAALSAVARFSTPISTIRKDADLFEESLKNHSLRRFREVQLMEEKTVPEEKL